MQKIEEVVISKISKGENKELVDKVVAEFPLTVFLNGEEVVTLLCTPEKMDYLALGFLQSEGLISEKDEVKNIEINGEEGCVEVNTSKETSSIVEKLNDKRTITSGCGKGTIFYNVVDSLQCKEIDSKLEITVHQVLELIKELQQRAELFKETGGTHSSALCTPEELLFFTEDIGRHNAVDKIVGQTIIEELQLHDKLLVTSGRISSEILLKVAKLGLPILISRAAPTSLTIKLAKELGITLIGFARGSRMNIYTNEWRIKK